MALHGAYIPPHIEEINMSNLVLFILIVSLLAMTLFLIAVSTLTPEERDEMLNDEEMWP